MFEGIGRFASRFRYPLIAVWLLLVVLVTLLAPSLADVAVADQSGFLPTSVPSIIAAHAAASFFPDQASPSQAVVVLESETGSLRDEAAQGYLVALTTWLQREAGPGLVGKVLSPADPALAARLLSRSGRVGIIFVPLIGSSQDPVVQRLVGTIQERLAGAPPGLVGYVTGSGPISIAYKENALGSAARTTFITIALVVVVLLIVYRSPVSPLVPLVTIAVAYGITRGLVAWLAGFGLTVSSFTDVFLVVLLFGAGTDYCLFLVSRFREFMGEGQPGPEAARDTIGRVGETITSSAATVAVGMLGMYFSRMKLFSNTGPSLALGIGVALLAGLTLTPALLAVLGRWAFWPGAPRRARAGGFWSHLAARVSHRAWLALALVLVLLAPLALYGRGQKRSFDLLADLADGVPAKAGFLLLSQEFGAGEMQPLEVIVTDLSGARSPQGLAHIDGLTGELLAVPGVADVRSLTLPAGKGDPALGRILRVGGQLSMIADALDQQGGGNDQAAGDLGRLRSYLADLSAAYQDMAGRDEFQAVLHALDRLEGDLEANRSLLLVSRQLDMAARGIAEARSRLARVDPAAVGQVGEAAAQLATLKSYLIGLATAYPAIVMLDGYPDALAAVSRLEASLTLMQNLVLVSGQLDMLALALSGMAKALCDPATLAQWSASPDQASGLASLNAYLGDMVSVYPELAQQTSYRGAMGHLEEMQAAVAALSQGQVLQVQLRMIAQQMGGAAEELESSPLSLIPVPGQPSPGDQMKLLRAYLKELGATYPLLAGTRDYQDAHTALDQMEAAARVMDITGARQALQALHGAFSGLAATAEAHLPEETFLPKTLPDGSAIMLPGVAELAAEMNAAAADLGDLAEFARQEMPQATFVPQTRLPSMGTLPDPGQGVGQDLHDLGNALERLGSAVAVGLPEATYVPSGGLSLGGEVPAGLQTLLADVAAFQSSLRTLAAIYADEFFVPTALVAENDLIGLLDTYTTPAGDAARLQVILADEPFSPAAQDTVARLRVRVEQGGKGHVSGGTAILLDLRIVMDEDLLRVMGLVLAGIAVVLVLLLRSVIAPVYLLATILLSYGATLGLVRLLFEALLHKQLTWWVPFFMFVSLVSLGMDYNIFLMGRVKEEVAENGTRAGVERALERTGGIITSAGIIMAGTFAAMMSSSLLGLVQLAFAITAGVLLDTFVIRTILVPAIAVLLDRWNWWPGKGPRK